jgi:thiamine kinase-like enzyme
MNEQVRAVIRLVSGMQAPLTSLMAVLGDEQITVTPLGGGLTNRNYLLRIDEKRCVLRIAGEGTEYLGIDRAREVACARAAARAGVAPEVVDYLPDHRALVTRFSPGYGLKSEDIRLPGVLARVVAAIRRFHDQPLADDVGPFSPFETVRSYLAQVRERRAKLPPELGPALETLTRLEKDLRTDEPLCLCHNDLLAANFLDNETRGTVHVIDWEYGGRGDRFFDLGNFAVNNDLGEEDERALLTHYFGEATDERLRRLRRMRLVSDMREAMWGFLQAEVSKLHTPDYYRDYGRKHLDRFLARSHTLV